MCLRHDVADLKAAIPSLPAGKADFAKSLIAQFEKKGTLSVNQQPWVGKLVALAFEKAAPKPATVSVGTFASVIAVFAKASATLKQPRIRLQLPTGEKAVLQLAPKTGNNPGFVYLKVSGDYAGKISPAGEFTPFKLPADLLESVKALFVLLGDDPAAVAAAYGKEVGACCFCAKEITTDESLAVGYGPDCAEHFGLPWGETRH